MSAQPPIQALFDFGVFFNPEILSHTPRFHHRNLNYITGKPGCIIQVSVQYVYTATHPSVANMESQ